MPEANDTHEGSQKPDKPPRVLVVDDEADVLEVIRLILAEHGFDVSAHSSATEALQRAKTRQFDAVVLDLYMPEMSGLLFHAKLKVLQPRLGSRTLFVSGYVSKEEVRQYLTTNARFLQKPFQAEELVRLVEEIAAGESILPASTP
jgi:CheY-like chemotaxis protein